MAAQLPSHHIYMYNSKMLTNTSCEHIFEHLYEHLHKHRYRSAGAPPQVLESRRPPLIHEVVACECGRVSDLVLNQRVESGVEHPII